MMPRAQARRAVFGIGLIEVLVALIVISIGVLGTTGMQLSGMRHSAGGLERSKALMQAENLAARMRINPAGDYGAFDTSAWAGSCDTRPVPYCQASVGSAGSALPAAACNADQLATFDLWSVSCGDWGGSQAGGQGVLDSMPDGRLRVDCDGPAGACAAYAISVEWSAHTARAGTEEPTDIRRVQLRLSP